MLLPVTSIQLWCALYTGNYGIYFGSSCKALSTGLVWNKVSGDGSGGHHRCTIMVFIGDEGPLFTSLGVWEERQVPMVEQDQHLAASPR